MSIGTPEYYRNASQLKVNPMALAKSQAKQIVGMI